ncbi:MAG TPA: DbpA RNA binding domain-containing protein [Gemmatimonadales bacterium]
MSGFAEWQIKPAVAAGLEQLGWRDDESSVRDVVPVVVRGGNVVAVLPPAPAWADPIMAALLGAQSVAAGAVLVLASPAAVSEWAVAIGAVTEPDPIRIDVARDVRGAMAGTGSRPTDVLIASPASALDRHTRSALHPEQFRAVVFAWPEEWQADDAVAALLQDFPRDAQRIVLTARADRIDGSGGVVERYARKAFVVAGSNDGPTAIAPPARETSVRTVPTSWSARALTVARVIGEIDPPSVTIWTADRRDHQLIQRALGSLRDGIRLATRTVPEDGIVICYDLPSPTQLVPLSAVGEVVLLVPPGAEAYVRGLAPRRRPMQLNSPAAAVLDRDAGLRQQISGALEHADHTAALYALSPLFEQSDPQLVAAAVFGLWRAAVATGGAPAPTAGGPAAAAAAAPADSPRPANPGSGIAKLWIGAGKKDEATVGDFVAVLIKEAGMERARIGRIELRDTFALVEVPAEEAEGIAQRLVGLTIRKRKLSARVDRGRGGKGGGEGRGGARGARG